MRRVTTFNQACKLIWFEPCGVAPSYIRDTERIDAPQALFSDYVPPDYFLQYYDMSVSPPMPSPDQREATISGPGLSASDALILSRARGPPFNWFLNPFMTGRPNIYCVMIVRIKRYSTALNLSMSAPPWQVRLGCSLCITYIL